jgi:hypothetical protein
LIVEKAEMLKAESGNQVSLLTSNLNGICPAVPGRRAAGDGGLSIAGRPVFFWNYVVHKHGRQGA